MTPNEEITVTVMGRGPKSLRSNSCSPSSLQKRLTRQLAGIMAHLERHPQDALSRARVDKIKSLLALSK